MLIPTRYRLYNSMEISSESPMLGEQLRTYEKPNSQSKRRPTYTLRVKRIIIADTGIKKEI